MEGIALDTIAVIAACSAIGGVAYHLWVGRSISVKQWIGALLLSGLCGVLAYLWLYEDIQNPLKLVAISIVFGAGGTSFLDLLIMHGLTKLKEALGKHEHEDD